MSAIRILPEDALPIRVLAEALRLRLAPGAELAPSVCASVVRRIAAVMAPVARSSLLDRVMLALRGVVDCTRDDLHEVLDDLIAGGDLSENPALLVGVESAPTLVFCNQPGFWVAGQRIHISGAAPDDAPCLPQTVAEGIQIDGCLRFLEPASVPEVCDALRQMGLQERVVEAAPEDVAGVSAEAHIVQLRTAMQSRGRIEILNDVRWLAAHQSSVSYRQRWRAVPEGEGLLVGRAPQAHGADVWYLVERDAARTRVLPLPTDGGVDRRGCDQAWRAQLAIDALAGAPATYQTNLADDRLNLRISFPLPSSERSILMYLGGRRTGAASAFTFCLPAPVLPRVEQLLRGAYFAPITP